MGEDISNEDVEETLRLVKEIPALASNVSDTIQNLLNRIQNDELQTDKGISFLDLKNHIFLNYVMNLTYVIQQKVSGKSIENSPAVERLAEARTVLEKMRPINEKLKYEMDKTTAMSGNNDTSNPLRFRPNPESLEAEDEDETQGGQKAASNIYVAPKIAASYFDDDDTLETRKKKILERSRKKALSSSVMYELRREFDTAPEEVKETVDPYKIKLNEELKERERYEEEYMTRLPMTKKQKHESRQLMTVTNFDTKFDDISALEKGTENISLKRRSSGKKGKFVKKHGKKKGKKRKH